jgi:hypothetical protein
MRSWSHTFKTVSSYHAAGAAFPDAYVVVPPCCSAVTIAQKCSVVHTLEMAFTVFALTTCRLSIPRAPTSLAFDG